METIVGELTTNGLHIENVRLINRFKGISRQFENAIGQKPLFSLEQIENIIKEQE